MFIHLGGEKVVRAREVIAIFDMSIEQSSKISKQYLNYNHKQGQVEKIGEEDSKSLVVTTNQLYYSPISSATLKKRAHHLVSI
jgi:hypothetical protein